MRSNRRHHDQHRDPRFIDSFRDETNFDSIFFDLLIDAGEVPEGLDMLNPDVERIVSS